MKCIECGRKTTGTWQGRIVLSICEQCANQGQVGPIAPPPTAAEPKRRPPRRCAELAEPKQ